MKLITIQNYILLIDEEAEIKGSPFICYNPLKITWDGDVVLYQGAMPEYNYRGLQKIIAYYPLTPEAKELDLPLLPNPFVEVEVEELALNESLKNINEEIKDQKVRWFYQRGFVKGYKAAQSKQFSLEDMKKAIEMAREYEFIMFGNGETEHMYSENEIIQSLSTQQLPKEFIPEYQKDWEETTKMFMESMGDNPEDFKYEETLKTLINSEGKEELVGTYK